MNKEEIIKDKKVLEALENQYKHVRCLVDSVRTTITDLDFEDMVPDADERFLMGGQLHAYEAVQDNLKNRIRFYRARIKREDGIKDWSEFKKTDRYSINVDVSREGDHSTTQHHCGQDADMDDACCQAKGDKPAITGESLRNLLGMQVCRCNVPCDVCAIDKRVGACVKLELVGGDYICLAPTPNTTTAIDDSPKSFEETYRDSMNLLREFCIKQSEANKRLVEALKEESEGLKKPSISFDEEEGNVMDDIKEKTEDFMNYLDSVVNG